MDNGTVWYKSKRLWLGLITLVGSFLQYKYGMVIDGPTQGMILGIIAIIIGIITKGPIDWTKPEI